MSGTNTNPNDPNPTRREDLNTAITVLIPELDGLKDIMAMPISVELKAAIQTAITARTERQTLIQNELNALDVAADTMALLVADGYPASPLIHIPGSLVAELQEKNSNIQTAINVFTADQIAAGPLTLSLNPNPPTKTGP